MKNNVSRDLVLDFRKNQEEQTFPDKYVMDISRRIMKKNSLSLQGFLSVLDSTVSANQAHGRPRHFPSATCTQ